MKLSQWAKQEGISYMTAFRWFRDGNLPVPAYQTKTGTIIIENTRVTSKESLKTYTYARVSTYEKKYDLKRQTDRIQKFCETKGWAIEKGIEEIASGMNDKRPKLTKLLSLQPGRIVVEHKDRLTRFGFNYFDFLLPKLGWELIVVNRDSEDEKDLMKDLVAIITSFCCRLYGLRRGQNKAKAVKKILQ